MLLRTNIKNYHNIKKSRELRIPAFLSIVWSQFLKQKTPPLNKVHMTLVRGGIIFKRLSPFFLLLLLQYVLQSHVHLRQF